MPFVLAFVSAAACRSAKAGKAGAGAGAGGGAAKGGGSGGGMASMLAATKFKRALTKDAGSDGGIDVEGVGTLEGPLDVTLKSSGTLGIMFVNAEEVA